MMLGKRFLRWLSPAEEDLREKMRETCATAQAGAEELERTVIMDGAAIRRALAQHMCDPDKTVPGQ